MNEYKPIYGEESKEQEGYDAIQLLKKIQSEADLKQGYSQLTPQQKMQALEEARQNAAKRLSSPKVYSVANRPPDPAEIKKVVEKAVEAEEKRKVEIQTFTLEMNAGKWVEFMGDAIRDSIVTFIRAYLKRYIVEGKVEEAERSALIRIANIKPSMEFDNFVLQIAPHYAKQMLERIVE